MSTHVRHSVGVDNLVVVDFATGDADSRIGQWRLSRRIPYAESCARQLWFGSVDDFETFPDQLIAPGKYTRYEGADAYVHFARFASGCEGQEVDTHNRGQFYHAWGVFCRNYRDVVDQYEPIVAAITADTGFVHKHITSRFEPQRHPLAARVLSGQGTGDDILIVGHLNSGGKLSNFTLGMIRACESRQKHTGRTGYITLTHPDDAVLARLREEVRLLETTGKRSIRSGICFAEFEDIGMAIELNDRVYVTVPMMTYPEEEAMLVDAWVNRSGTENTLTHMHGCVGARGMSSGPWADPRLGDGYISPEDVRAEMQRRGENNADILRRADMAFRVCAEIRLEGGQPNKPAFMETAPAVLKPTAA